MTRRGVWAPTAEPNVRFRYPGRTAQPCRAGREAFRLALRSLFAEG